MNTHAALHNSDNTHSLFGFWLYILSDCLLFASLFATYAVLHGNTFGGPASIELFSLPFVLLETIILLTSSFTCGLAMLAVHHHKQHLAQVLLSATLVLGLSFLFLEFTEFRQLVSEGSSWQRSGFLSAFFTLVGTHGLHVFFGCVWLSVLIIQSLRRGLTTMTVRQLLTLSLFWHFLDIVWIFIFSFVYLIGVL